MATFKYLSTVILFNDSINETKLKIPLIIILIFSIVISLINYIVLLKLLSKYELEREKPINLFLTLKKSVFETLKNSTENFSNKLLKKAFGNEDGNDEEESKKTYKKNIHPKDINIVKFKAESQFSPINSCFFIFAYCNWNIYFSFILYNLFYC